MPPKPGPIYIYLSAVHQFVVRQNNRKVLAMMGCFLQVMSKSCACKFLYGQNTSKDEIAKLENALETHTELKTEIEFYRKNGKDTKEVI
jgi:hypothetical protein